MFFFKQTVEIKHSWPGGKNEKEYDQQGVKIISNKVQQ